MGENDGVKNEKELEKTLNGKCFSELNDNLKKFMKCLSPKIKRDSKIKCDKIGEDRTKGDLEISIDDKEHYVSVKVGDSLSVHQENVDIFEKEFLEKNNCPEDVKKLLKCFIKSAKPEGHLLKDQKEKCQVQKYLNKNKVALLNRFLKNGRSGTPADYIYYGNCNNGKCLEIDSFINDNKCKNGNGKLWISILNLQAMCRECKKKSREKDDLQVKLSERGRKLFSKEIICFEKCEN